MMQFRKKKKIIMKEKYKTNESEISCKTPVKEQEISSFSDWTDRTHSIKMKSETSEQKASSLLLKRMQKNTKDCSRTLYYG